MGDETAGFTPEADPVAGRLAEAPDAPAVPGVTRWRQKSVTVEAIQWTGENLEAIQALTGPERAYLFRNGRLCVVTLGERLLDIGCWVMRAADGEIWVSAEKSFTHNYEPASQPLSAAQCDRLRQMADGWRNAVKAVRDALDFAATEARTDGPAEIIAAAREALKVLSGEEADHG